MVAASADPPHLGGGAAGEQTPRPAGRALKGSRLDSFSLLDIRRDQAAGAVIAANAFHSPRVRAPLVVGNQRQHTGAKARAVAPDVKQMAAAAAAALRAVVS